MLTWLDYFLIFECIKCYQKIMQWYPCCIYVHVYLGEIKFCSFVRSFDRRWTESNINLLFESSKGFKELECMSPFTFGFYNYMKILMHNYQKFTFEVFTDSMHAANSSLSSLVKISP